jgi:hypothetical protein
MKSLNNTKPPILLLYCCFFPFVLFGQTVFISGYVTDAESGEALPGAHIMDLHSTHGSSANPFGFYRLSLRADSALLVASYVGYRPDTVWWSNANGMSLDFTLTPAANLQTVEVLARSRIEDRTGISMLRLSAMEIEALPSIMGEADVMRALQLLPGVHSGNEGQTGLYVRGGSPDQNLILLDGIPVYNAAHLFGFFSVFNTDAIKEVNIIKGGFPARYGGRLASVVDVRMKEGNVKEWKGTASLGLISSKFSMEGPLKKDRTAVLISARRTYIDALARPFVKKALKEQNQRGGLGYYFQDFNLRINHKLSEQDRLHFSGYWGSDRYRKKEIQEEDLSSFTRREGLSWGNQLAALRWQREWNRRLFSNVALSYSRFAFDTRNGTDAESVVDGATLQNVYDLFYSSGIRDVSLRLDSDYLPHPGHYIRFGGYITNHRFKPGEFDQYIRRLNSREDLTLDTLIAQPEIAALEWGIYLEDEMELTDRLSVNAGFHLSGYSVEKDQYLSLQPRLSLHWKGRTGWALQSSFALMRQYVQLLTNSNVGLPTDLWLPSTGRIKPQEGWQAALGLSKSGSTGHKMGIEFFYKRTQNVLAYKPGVSLFDADDWQNRVLQGRGEAYGAEWLYEKQWGKLRGWLAYTLAWSWRQFEGLNEGERFPFRYDRRHDISIAGVYTCSPRLSFSAAWVFGTGNALTLPKTYFTTVGLELGIPTGPQIDYGPRNNFRTPPYHRLDISVDFRKKKQKYTRTLSLGAYNVYGRRNPFYVKFTAGDGHREGFISQTSLFAFIPSFVYKIDF